MPLSSPRLRFLPTITEMIFITLLLSLTVGSLAPRLLQDADLLWHIRNGQHILATGSIPHTDWFAAGARAQAQSANAALNAEARSMSCGPSAGREWIAWEWLYDVVVGWLDHYGLNGPVALSALLIAALFAGLFRALLRRCQRIGISISLTLLAFAASSVHMLARPHLVTWVLTAVFWLVLDRDTELSNAEPSVSARSGEPAVVGGGIGFAWAAILGAWRSLAGLSGFCAGRVWILVPLTLLWANLHAGFVLGLLLIALFLAASLRQWKLADSRSKSKLQSNSKSQPCRHDSILATRARRLAAVLVSAVTAGCVNPYGLGLYRHIYEYLTNTFLQHHVSELKSPNFHHFPEICFLFLIVGTLFAAGRSRRCVAPHLWLTVLFATALGLFATRNIPMAAILLTLSLASGLASTTVPTISPPRDTSGRFSSAARAVRARRELQATRYPYVWVAKAAILGLIANGGWLGSHRVMDAHLDPGRFPVQAVDFLARQGVGGPVFLPDDWSGVVVYRLPPRLVYVDDRHDYYGESFLRNYLSICGLQPGWEAKLDATGVRTLLLPVHSGLTTVLHEREIAGDSVAPRVWKTTYADSLAVVMVRTQSAESSPLVPSR